MNVRLLQCFSLSMILAVPTSLALASSGCAEKAATLLGFVKNQAHLGLADRTGEFAAEANALDAKLDCGEMDQTQYCKSALPLAESRESYLYDAFQGEPAGNTVQLTDVISAQRDLRKVKALCHSL